MRHTITTERGTFDLLDVGEGPPILFVHGALVDGSLWSDVVERLKPRFRCLVPEMPLGSHTTPFGADTRPVALASALDALLETLDVDRAVVIGNDSGGAISQLFAARHPERIAHLVLTNCDVLETFPPRAYRYMERYATRPAELALTMYALNAFPRLGLRETAWGGLAREMPLERIKRWVRPGLRRAIRDDAAGFVAGVSPALTVDAAATLRESDVPITLVWGAADRYFTKQLAQRFARHVPHAEVDLVEGAKAYVMLDEPERVASALRQVAAPVSAAA